jgi:hypothetical protein
MLPLAVDVGVRVVGAVVGRATSSRATAAALVRRAARAATLAMAATSST